MEGKQLELAIQMYIDSENKDLAFNDIVNLIHPYIIAKIRKSVKSIEDVEDLYQDILLKLFTTLERFDTKRGKPFAHYLNCMIRSTKVDYIRKVSTSQRKMESVIQETSTALHLYNNVETLLIKKEITSSFDKVLFCLTPIEKQVFQYMLNDYKPAEIALQLQIERKVVYNSIQRCKMKLKNHLNYLKDESDTP